jgi:oligopeptide/dipeptide ABC transporter ATP-binding protein
MPEVVQGGSNPMETAETGVLDEPQPRRSTGGAADEPLLVVDGLTVQFPTADGVVQAVSDLSYTVEQGRTLGIVGESGSGKSVSSMAVMGLHDPKMARISGSIRLAGQEIIGLSERKLQQIRGKEAAMIFQDPLSSLHPFFTIGHQLAEAYRVHNQVSKSKAKAKAIEMLDRVGIPQARTRVDDYPHQFSGGMRQRVMIAMAMSLNPDLLIADEPTTALDVTVQAQVLDVMRRLQEEFGTAIVLITHDLGVVADMADEVVVMYAGAVMERAPRRDIFYRSHHPYTQGLLESLPAHGGTRGPLTPIPGTPPSLIRLPRGCPFAPRCRYAFDRCRALPPPLETVLDDDRHRSACWLPSDEVRRPPQPSGSAA